MNNGLFYKLATTLVSIPSTLSAPLLIILASSSLLPLSASAQTQVVAQSHTTTTHSHLLPYGRNSNLNQPRKTLGGAYSSNRLKGSSRRKFTPRNVNRVRLQSKFPRKLGIANYDVVWKVKNVKGRNVQRSRGKIATMNLSPGKYRVTLQIGKYKQNKTIRVRRSRNNVQSFSMPIKAGLLKVSTGTSKSSLNKAKIYVKNRAGRVVASSNGRPIKRLLRSGKYTVEVAYGNKRRGRNVVHVRNGSIKETTVRMPASAKIRLRAVRSGNQPLMKRSSWVVYNSAGKVVSRTKTRTHRMSLLPGTYTAKLTVGKKVKKKKFRVASGQNRTISISL